MKVEKFEDMIVWQKAKILTVSIYKDFYHCRDYSFRDQIQRATVSIMNNIAEGYERGSDKDFVKFLYIAKGSCAEVRSLIHLCVDLKYLPVEICRERYSLALEVSKMLFGWIKSLK